MQQFEELYEVFNTLTHALLKQADTAAEVVEHVTTATQLLIGGADFVSVTLRGEDGRYFTPVATSDICCELDQVQYRHAEGPCVECAREDGPGFAYSSQLSTDERWPHFGPAAAALGVESVLSTTLVPGPRVMHPPGALNVYAAAADGIGEEDKTMALVLTSHLSLALAHTSAVNYHQLKEHQLKQAIASRDVIGQAKGILMHRQGISAEKAFELLRQTSQDLNVKLAEVALTVVTRHGELGER